MIGQLNGTSLDTLYETHTDARMAVINALTAHRATMPNGRDYVGDERGLAEAQGNYWQREALLNNVSLLLEEEQNAIVEAMD